MAANGFTWLQMAELAANGCNDSRQKKCHQSKNFTKTEMSPKTKMLSKKNWTFLVLCQDNQSLALIGLHGLVIKRIGLGTDALKTGNINIIENVR